jgi:hypothetical protein
MKLFQFPPTRTARELATVRMELRTLRASVDALRQTVAASVKPPRVGRPPSAKRQAENLAPTAMTQAHDPDGPDGDENDPAQMGWVDSRGRP